MKQQNRAALLPGNICSDPERLRRRHFQTKPLQKSIILYFSAASFNYLFNGCNELDSICVKRQNFSPTELFLHSALLLPLGNKTLWFKLNPPTTRESEEHSCQTSQEVASLDFTKAPDGFADACVYRCGSSEERNDSASL